MLGWARLDKPRRLTRRLARAACLAASLALTSCAAPSSYMGIDLAGPAVSAEAAELQLLARRAQAGDKRAQLNLGIRYEEGRGVPQDLKRARELYQRAAATTGGTMWVYQPPVSKGAKGGVVPVDSGPKLYGLQEAKRRLARLSDSRNEAASGSASQEELE
jgi:hypothetical protein